MDLYLDSKCHFLDVSWLDQWRCWVSAVSHPFLQTLSLFEASLIPNVDQKTFYKRACWYSNLPEWLTVWECNGEIHFWMSLVCLWVVFLTKLISFKIIKHFCPFKNWSYWSYFMLQSCTAPISLEEWAAATQTELMFKLTINKQDDAVYSPQFQGWCHQWCHLADSKTCQDSLPSALTTFLVRLGDTLVIQNMVHR